MNFIFDESVVGVVIYIFVQTKDQGEDEIYERYKILATNYDVVHK